MCRGYPFSNSDMVEGLHLGKIVKDSNCKGMGTIPVLELIKNHNGLLDNAVKLKEFKTGHR